MKKLTTIFLLMIVSAITTLAQTNDEKDILKFIADYDQAYLNKDISFAERVWADNYVISTETGEKGNRVQSLEEARKDKADPNPKTKLLSFKSVNDSIHVSGKMAMVSGTWTSSEVMTDDLKGEPHIDTGRYTMVVEKRNGKWMVIAEHFSEAPHDKKLMESQVLKMGLAYNKMIADSDAAAIEKILADEFTYTDDKGKFLNKTEEMATYKNRQSKIISTETTDQKVRVIGNNAAIETGIFRVKGTDKDGKPFEETDRYTTTWVWRNLRWQIVSDHTSKIENK